MTQRYLVALNGHHPHMGGFTYADIGMALAALIDLRQRWPRAALIVRW